MKILKRVLLALFLILLGGVVILLFLSSRRDIGRMTHALVIDRRPVEVWPFLTEPEKLKRWIEGLVEIRVLNRTPDIVGSREVMVLHDPNLQEKVQVEVETTAYDKPRSVAIKMKGEGFSGVVAYTLTELPDGRTRLDYDANFVFSGFAARLLEPLVMPQARVKEVADLNRLKALVESGPRLDPGTTFPG